MIAGISYVFQSIKITAVCWASSCKTLLWFSCASFAELMGLADVTLAGTHWGFKVFNWSRMYSVALQIQDWGIYWSFFFLFCTFELSNPGRLALAQRNCELWWFSAEKETLLRGTCGCMSLTAAQWRHFNYCFWHLFLAVPALKFRVSKKFLFHRNTFTLL